MSKVTRRTLLASSALPLTAAALGCGAPVPTGAGSCDGIITSPEPAELLLFGGQSNAGPSGTRPAVLGAEYPCRVVTFSTGQVARGAHQLDPAILTDLGPVDDGADRQSMIGSTTGFALEAANRAADRESPGYLVFTAQEGGVPLTDLIRGAKADHYSFGNLVDGVARAKALLADHGRDAICKGYFFVHGENGSAPGERSARTERRRYASMLGDYIDDVTATIRNTVGQDAPPHFFLVQINSVDTGISPSTSENWAKRDPYNVGVVLAQLDVARERFGRGVTLAGPAYQVQVSDNIHHNNVGRMMLGELFALAYQKITTGERYVPLWPTGAGLTDRRIEITFELPGRALAFDTDWVKTVPHQGFSYVDDDDSAKIIGVALHGTNRVQITLDRPPTGANPKIRYACGNESPAVDDQWSAARGLLYSDSGIPSHYAERYNLPETIRHYAVRFELPLG